MKEDFWTFVVCALVTMIVGTQVGLLTGIVMSFVTMMIGRFIQRSSVKSWILGIEMETEDIVPISVVSDGTVIDAKQSVDYLSSGVIEHKVENALHVSMNDETQIQTKGIERCVIDLRSVKYIDATGVETLSVIDMDICKSQILINKFNTETKRLCLLVENDYIAQRAESLGSSLSKTISFEQVSFNNVRDLQKKDAQVQISIQ